MSDERKKGDEKLKHDEPPKGAEIRKGRRRAGVPGPEPGSEPVAGEAMSDSVDDEYSHRFLDDEECCCEPPGGRGYGRHGHAHHRHLHRRHHRPHHGAAHGGIRPGDGGPVTVQINLMLPEQMVQTLAQCCYPPEDCCAQPVADCCMGKDVKD